MVTDDRHLAINRVWQFVMSLWSKRINWFPRRSQHVRLEVSDGNWEEYLVGIYNGYMVDASPSTSTPVEY